MIRKRLQNKVAEGRWTLPICIVVALACWALWFERNTGLFDETFVPTELFVALPCLIVIVCTTLLVWMNQHHALLHTYSRMISSTFLVISIATLPFFTSLEPAVITLSYIVCCLFLFESYQDRQASGYVFFAFAAFGIGSLYCVQLLFLVPIIWILLLTRILAFSPRTFMASLLGLLLPYWVAAAAWIYQGKPQAIVAHFNEIATFKPLTQWLTIKPDAAVNIAFLAFIYIIGTVNFFRLSRNEKIKTRMLYQFFAFMGAVCLLFIGLQPNKLPQLLPIMAVNTAPLAAYYFTTTRSFASNLLFIFTLILTLATALYNSGCIARLLVLLVNSK